MHPKIAAVGRCSDCQKFLGAYPQTPQVDQIKSFSPQAIKPLWYDIRYINILCSIHNEQCMS